MSRILIIEDEVAIADLERDYLELSGFTVEIENTGDVGLARALKEEFDLFILDLMLPGVDGFEICKRIRDEKNTPILMVSAKKEDIDKIRGLGLGADDYITKPFSPSELVARVKAHLARYERLIGSSVETRNIIEIPAVCGLMRKKKHLPPRNLTCFAFWQKIRIVSIRKKNCLKKSGIWNRLAILQL